MATTQSKAKHAANANANAAQVERFPYSVWRDDVDAAAKDMVTASSRVLALVLQARGKVEEDTVREALQHAFGEAYADLQGVPFELALKAKSVKNRISDAMAVFKAVVLPNVLPSNLQHAAAECRKANRKAVEAANEPEGDTDGADEEPGLNLPAVGDMTHAAIKAMLASLEVLRGAAKSHVLVSLLSDLGDLIVEVEGELDAEE